MTLVLQPPTFPLEEKNHWRTTCSERSEPQLNCSGAPAVRTVPKSTTMLPLSIPGSPVGKRKLESPLEECEYRPPTKRISPFLNTPKQRRDERRKLYRISMNKLRQIDDSEAFLRRSVLINNLARRMQKELRDEKQYRYPQAARSTEPETMPPCARRSRHMMPPAFCTPSSSPSLPASIFDDTFSLSDKITDDMSETLMRTVDALGGTITSATTPSEDVIMSPVSVPTSQQTSPTSDLSRSPTIECSGMTERDRQILGEMDAVFNSLLSMFAESVETQHGS